jgi:glyoxylase-like metal-dependent hydrolase (beta-lactamase superfamily II)
MLRTSLDGAATVDCMTDISHRRGFLKATLGTAAAATIAQVVPLTALARDSKTELTVTPLNDRLFVIRGAGANVVAMKAPEGALLVDGGVEARSGELVKLALRQTGAKKVHTLINTHWHPEQTGSNERLGKDGARIISHVNTKLWLGYANDVPWQEKKWGPLSAKGLPNDTTYGDGAIELGGEHIEYTYLLQAHTDGDLAVRFKESNVIAAGGVVSSDGWPVIDYKTGGWINGLVDGLRDLIQLCDASTKVVPANGPVVGKADLEEQMKMYQTISQRMNGLLRKGMGPEEVLAAGVTKEFDARWGEPTKFVTLAFKSLWGHMAPDA